jgi:hypothetical protein
LVADSSARIAILGNRIFSNVGLGIDLGGDGVTPNDDPNIDVDAGANGLLNFPELISATRTATSLTAQGTIISTPGTKLRIEFFASTSPDPSGHGEGQSFLGSTTVTTGPKGGAGIAASFGLLGLPLWLQGPGVYVSATATSPTNNTSEFSGAVPVTAPAPPPPPAAVVPPPAATPPAPLGAGDVTGQLLILRGRPRRLRNGHFQQALILVNPGGAVAGPLTLVLSSLSRGLRLRQAKGATGVGGPPGRPNMGWSPDGEVFGPGQSATLVLEFLNPGRRPLGYAVQVLAGLGSV